MTAEMESAMMHIVQLWLAKLPDSPYGSLWLTPPSSLSIVLSSSRIFSVSASPNSDSMVMPFESPLSSCRNMASRSSGAAGADAGALLDANKSLPKGKCEEKSSATPPLPPGVGVVASSAVALVLALVAMRGLGCGVGFVRCLLRGDSTGGGGGRVRFSRGLERTGG